MIKRVKIKKRLYWDTAASTALDPLVFRAMKPYLERDFGNPASLHHEGSLARRAVDEARAKIAKVLKAHPDEIIFTGSGTESDNLAILGTMLWPVLSASKPDLLLPPQLITSIIEHPAVVEPARYLQSLGGSVIWLPVDSKGRIDLIQFKEALTPATRLVSIMLANNEIGTIQPIRDLAKIIRQYRRTQNSSWPYLHTDACQAPRFLDLDVAKLGVDLLSFNGSKIYGPKGVGALYVRRGVSLSPLILGGGQEAGRRSGTLNVAGIVGLAEALEICARHRERESRQLARVRDHLANKLQADIKGLIINGALSQRLPNNLNFSVTGFEGEQLVLELDAWGVAVSSGSACSHDQEEGSATMMAISNNDRARATGAVRVSLGRVGATVAEANYFVRALKTIVAKYQNYQTPGV